MLVRDRSSSEHAISKCSRFEMIWASCERLFVLWERFATDSLMYVVSIVSRDCGRAR